MNETLPGVGFMHADTFFLNYSGNDKEFVSLADEEMTDLLKAYAHMKQEYASVLKFFGEDLTSIRIDDFFGTFAAFISDFEVRRRSCVKSYI